MENAISRQWYQLYENNKKIQAFAVAKGKEIVWQTENWNLTEDVKTLLDAPISAAGKLAVGGVKYKRITSTQDRYVASSGDNQGHLLMARVDDESWIIAWAEDSSIPELAIIDVEKAAIHLKGAL
ncbi:hypothetical protein EU527_19885 [Candidatus Thorarchaeota archaeon]|nr:MAG: hypothetical protein EU527_19885 [Candidatus Thorarchaeota archaeon]